MEQPQLQGVVIISLPPPGDPTKGKTITAAFSLSDPRSHHHVGDHLPLRSPPSLPPSSSRRTFFSPKRSLATIAGTAIVLFSLWLCLFSEAPLQLLRDPAVEDGDRRETESFILPLYHKSARRVPSAITEVKLGSLEVGGVVGLQTGRSSKVVVSVGINSSVVFPIRGNVLPDGQYYTSIFVGNPPRPYYLDVDTGSDLAWIQCDAPCTSCAKGPHPLYKPSKGKIVPPRDSLCREVQTNENYVSCESCKQCDYEIEYADHSSSMGVLARDDMYLTVANGDPTQLNFVFGCAYDQQGQLLASPAKTDGILGLSSAKVSLPSQLAGQGVINNVVGHCISSEANASGYMFLGDDFVPRWGMTWVPSLGGLTSMKDVRQFFKPLTLQFENRWLLMPTTLTLPPEDYLTISNKGNICLGILNGSEVHDGSTIILGDVSLRGKLVVYDNVHQKIGWVQSECAKPQKPMPFPFFL